MKARFSHKTVLLAIAFGFALCWACKKSTGSAAPKPPLTVDYVTASVSGRVTDPASKPLANVTVFTAFAMATTDVNGRFSISNTQLDKNAGFVTAQKAGFFNGSRTFL